MRPDQRWLNERTVRARLNAGGSITKHAQWSAFHVYDADGKRVGRANFQIWKRLRKELIAANSPVPKNAALLKFDL